MSECETPSFQKGGTEGGKRKRCEKEAMRTGDKVTRRKEGREEFKDEEEEAEKHVIKDSSEMNERNERTENGNMRLV